MIDVVIPAHAKDFHTLRHSIRGVLRYVSPLRRVVVVSATPYETRDERVIWVPEPDSGTLPSLEAVHSDWESRSADATPRAAWVYQQLLKLGAATYIEDLTPRFLVIDADVIFLRPVSFDEGQGRFLYSRATEYHPVYNESFRRLFQSEPPSGHSFTAHHMLYDRDLLEELFAEIEQAHEESWFWAYVHAADPAESSAINEQDMFGLWMLSRHPELSRHRQLFWRDVQTLPGPIGRAHLGLDYDFVAAHAYARQGRWRRFLHMAYRLAAEVVPSLSGYEKHRRSPEAPVDSESRAISRR